MILNRQRTVRVARPPLEQFLRRVREQLKLNGADVTVCLVSDDAIARMNETFRHKNGPTDVLSFPNDAKDVVRAQRQGTASAVPKRARGQGASAPEGNFLGDIAISPATARRNAKKLGRTLANELQILILHGVLHLLGYDHETDNGQMTRVENRLRRGLGLS